MAKKRINIAVGIVCPDCGSVDLRGAGREWRNNPNGDNPKRIQVQRLRCNKCGRPFTDGEIKT